MSFEDLINFSGQIFLLKSLQHSDNLLFRGEIIHLEEENRLGFLGSPWLASADDLKQFGLSLSDYALHDASTDMLQVMKMKDIAVSDIRLLNEKLEESESRYRELVEYGSDIIYKLDGKGNIIYANDVFCSKLSYQKSSILNQNFEKFLPEKWIKKGYTFFEEFLRDPKGESYVEFPVKSGSGDTVWLGQNILTAPAPDGTREVRCFAKDITERKVIEEDLQSTELRLSNLISTLYAGILVEDEDRKIVLTNPYFCDLFQIPVPPENLVGVDCSESAEQSKHLFDDPDDFVVGITETLKDKKLRIGDELHMADGRILERDYIPIYADQKYLGHLWQYRDLTEKKIAEKNLIKARKEAEAARDAEKQFLAHMSHEIRTPLTAILGMNHLMKETDLTPDQVEFLKIQEKSTLILSRLINNILDISKVDAGKIEVSATKVNLNALLSDQYKTFSLQVFEKPVEFKFAPIVGLNEFIWCDGVLINQVLYNLIGNAIKFTNEGFVELKGELLNETVETATVRISVIDSGIGIPDEKKEHVFERFRQADQETSVTFGGTGLGLAITKKIVDVLHGEIELESSVGEGSCFSIILEFKKTGEELLEEESKEQTFSSLETWQNLSFLAAEDNQMNTFYIKRILKKTGVNVDYVLNGKEAVQRAKKKQYDLILMDIRMPVMDGIEATKRIRAGENLNTGTPILALTASAFKSQIDKAITAGTNDFLPKPFTPRQLLKKIQEMLPHTETVAVQETKPSNNNDIKVSETEIREIYGDDFEFAMDMYNMFLEGNHLEFIGIGEILQKGDFPLAREVVHRVKPSFSMIGLPKLQESMQELENLCDQKSEKCLYCYQEIAKQLEANLPEIKKLLTELNEA